MRRITISLSDQERIALHALAENEFREPRAQATLIIRRELERLGLLITMAQDSDTNDNQQSSQKLKEEEIYVSK